MLSCLRRHGASHVPPSATPRHAAAIIMRIYSRPHLPSPRPLLPSPRPPSSPPPTPTPPTPPLPLRCVPSAVHLATTLGAPGVHLATTPALAPLEGGLWRAREGREHRRWHAAGCAGSCGTRGQLSHWGGCQEGRQEGCREEPGWGRRGWGCYSDDGVCCYSDCRACCYTDGTRGCYSDRKGCYSDRRGCYSGRRGG